MIPTGRTPGMTVNDLNEEEEEEEEQQQQQLECVAKPSLMAARPLN